MVTESTESVPTEIQKPTDPPAPDMSILQQYVDIIRFLYSRPGPTHDRVYIDLQGYYNQGALIACRNWLMEHTEVDQWVDVIPDYWDNACDWDRQAALARFTCLEDVPIRDDQAQFDANENCYFFTLSEYGYDTQGRLTRRTNIGDVWSLIDYDVSDSLYNALLTYDENGVFSQLTDARYEGEAIHSVRVALYDDQGRLAGFQWHGDVNTGVIQITYDDQGRIIMIESPAYPGAPDYTIARYRYDGNGNLVWEEKRFFNASLAYPAEDAVENIVIETVYTYDAQGVLLSSVRTEENWDYSVYFDPVTGRWEYGHFLKFQTVDRYTFTFDDGARLKSILIANGDTYYMSGELSGQVAGEALSDFTQIDVIYGQYWFFDGK
jgi:hypothetical protein